MDLNTRFLLVMKHLGYNKGDFAHKLNVSQAVISHISSGRNKPGTDLLLSLLSQFGEISADWLLLGNGEMLRQKEVLAEVENLLKLIDEIKLLNDMNYNSLNIRVESLKSLFNKAIVSK